MKKALKKIIRNILGTFAILLGLVGLVVPGLQGLLLLFIGIGLLDFNKKKVWIAKLKKWKVIRPFVKWYDAKKAKAKDKFEEKKREARKKFIECKKRI